MPEDVPFQLATLVSRAPEGEDWIHEVKYDGYRLRVVVHDGRARVLTRNGGDWTARFPGVARAASGLAARDAMLDGEAVVFDPEGRSDFGMLQRALSEHEDDRVVFTVFDLLYLDGYDLRGEPLRRRKELLRSLTETGSDPAIAYVDHWSGHGPDFHASACRLLLEGSVSKRAEAPWRPGRTRDWQKTKCLARQEFVVVGFTEPRGSRHGLGALLLGVHDGPGGLRYAGRVGTGFDEGTLADLRERLDRIRVRSPSVEDAPHADGVHWVRPTLVAEVAFREWTRDGLVRQASFKGLRTDKRPADVVRERPSDPPARAASAADPVRAPSTGRAGASGTPLRVAGVRITNPDKVLEPAGISKRDLALYYERVADAMLPHLAGRLITAVRCPSGEREGSSPACFYQKHPEARGWPRSLHSRTVRDKEGPADYFYAEDVAGLVSLAQLGCLEIHTWGSLAKDPERPDRIVLDLDPGEGLSFADVAAAARVVRDALGALGLMGFAKTTGGRGLHVVVPIEPEHDFEVARAFSHKLCERVAAADPDRFTDKMAKRLRPGRVFIDYLRNAHGATAVCAYSTRARPGAPVSVPVTWRELERIDPAKLDTRTVPRRLAALGADPWSGYEKQRGRLTAALLAAMGVVTGRPA